MTSELKKRDNMLLGVKTSLKEQFTGIDSVIDQFIDAVRVWYIMPELMSRPVIVNLWGLTGTGKTSLVRAFAKAVQMTDSFVEIQMDSASETKSIRDYIDKSNIEQHLPSILLLDEIQRFRTVDDTGHEIRDKKGFSDVWMLLSDGKFQTMSENKSEIMMLLLDDEYYEQIEEEKEKKKDKNLKYKMREWSARRVKKLTKSPESVEEIMTWTQEKKTDVLRKALDNVQTFEGDSYSKMLIFISGNIDEAYDMSGDVSNSDTDADVFHEFSKKINIINIKDSLTKRFKPEQIARFGNNHIIYPSLSKKNYQDIIKKIIDKFTDNIKRLHNINIELDESVFKTIYENGVFPSQGVRPVISTISSIFENYVPIFLLKAIEENTSHIRIEYDDSNIIGEINNIRMVVPVELTINKIKKDKNIQERVSTSVHEAGHAVVYSILFRVTPTQIKSATSSSTVGGFVGVHMLNLSKNFAHDVIAVSLAGQAAEEIVFGEEYKSAGASSDIMHATRTAADYIRTYGFAGIQSRLSSPYSQDAIASNTDIEKTNTIIENMLIEGKKRAIDIINSNASYFKEIISKLIDNGEISPHSLYDVAMKYGVTLIHRSPEVKLIHNYDEKWYQYTGKKL